MEKRWRNDHLKASPYGSHPIVWLPEAIRDKPGDQTGQILLRFTIKCKVIKAPHDVAAVGVILPPLGVGFHPSRSRERGRRASPARGSPSLLPPCHEVPAAAAGEGKRGAKTET